MTSVVPSSSFARQPLDIILSAIGNVRVMRALLAHGDALSVSRLAEDTWITPNGVRRVLHQLERAGVVEGLGSGRSRLFRTAPGHSIVSTLDTLFTAEHDRFEDMISRVRAAAEDDRIHAVWLFGSVARREDTIDSDLDLAIVVNTMAKEVDVIADTVRDRLGEHERHFGYAVSLVAMSLDDLKRLSSENAPLWRDLLRDGRVIKGFTPADLEMRLGKAVPSRERYRDDASGNLKTSRPGSRARAAQKGSGVPRGRQARAR